MMKRAMDFIGAAVVLAPAAPVILLAGAAIWLFDGRPVFWTQARSGLGGRRFRLWKFRTMSNARDAAGCLLPDRERLTRVGALLRAWSLDELPQLWNVLQGEMSLVGPRPLVSDYDARYDARQRRRLEVKPGITGWCQINGRNALSWDAKFELDVWYVEHRSLWLDLQILLRTLPAVFGQRGISQAGHATMPEFLGGAHGE